MPSNATTRSYRSSRPSDSRTSAAPLSWTSSTVVPYVMRAPDRSAAPMRMSCSSRRGRPVFGGTSSPPSCEGTATTSAPRWSWNFVVSHSKPTSRTWSRPPSALSARSEFAGWLMPTPYTLASGLISTISTSTPRFASAAPAPRPPMPAPMTRTFLMSSMTVPSVDARGGPRVGGLHACVVGQLRRRIGLHHGVRHRHVAVEGVRALVGMPALRLPVGDVEPVAAGVDLHPHAAAGRAEVEVVLLAHAVAAGAELDRDVGVEQDDGRAQELVARVDPPRDVVQAAGHAGLVEDDPEVVGLLVVRDHREHRDVGVGEDRVLGERVGERVAVPLGVAHHVVAHHGHVVDLPWRDPARHVALRAVGERGLHPRRRDVALVLPEELVDLAAGGAVAVGAPVAGRVLEPALAGAGRVDLRDRGLEVGRAPRAPGHVAEPGVRALGELEAVVAPFAPRAEVDRLPRPAGLDEPEHVGVERQGVLRLRGEHLDVGEMRDEAARHGLSSGVRAAV